VPLNLAEAGSDSKYVYQLEVLLFGLIKASVTKLSFLFYDFYVIYCDFSKNSTEINKKKKTKPLSKPGRDVMCTVLKVEGCILSDFRVQG